MDLLFVYIVQILPDTQVLNEMMQFVQEMRHNLISSFHKQNSNISS